MVSGQLAILPLAKRMKEIVEGKVKGMVVVSMVVDFSWCKGFPTHYSEARHSQPGRNLVAAAGLYELIRHIKELEVAQFFY